MECKQTFVAVNIGRNNGWMIKVDTELLWMAYEMLGKHQDILEQILEQFNKKWFDFCEEEKNGYVYEEDTERRKKDMREQINRLSLLRMSLEKAIYVYEKTEEHFIVTMEERNREDRILKIKEQSTEVLKQQLQKLQLKM